MGKVERQYFWTRVHCELRSKVRALATHVTHHV